MQTICQKRAFFGKSWQCLKIVINWFTDYSKMMANDERYMILPYKQRVTGSNPVAPTRRRFDRNVEPPFIYPRLCLKSGRNKLAAAVDTWTDLAVIPIAFNSSPQFLYLLLVFTGSALIHTNISLNHVVFFNLPGYKYQT